MNRRIKILFVVTFIKNVGVYNVVSNIINNIDKNKYEISIVSCVDEIDDEEQNKLIKSDIKVYNLEYQSLYKAMIFGQNKLQLVIDEINPDIVHSHAILSDVLVSSIKTKAKKISTIHCILEEDYYYSYGKILYKAILRYHLHKLSKFDLLIGCSNSVKNYLLKYFKNVEAIVNRTVANRKNINNNYLRKFLNLKNSDIIYTYLGSLTERKNIVSLVKNFNMYRNDNEHLVVVGEGNLLETCRQYNYKGIYFLGFVNNPNDILSSSDIYISLSKSEGMPLSVVEAMEYGLFLFLSDISPHAEIFEICKDVENLGILTNESNFKTSIIEARTFYDKINKEKIIMAKNMYFNLDLMIKEYSDSYDRIINE